METGNLGQLIRTRRKQLGLSLEELGRRIGFSTAHVARLERNALRRPVQPHIIDRLIKHLGLSRTEVERALGSQAIRSESVSVEGVSSAWSASFWMPYTERSQEAGLRRLESISPTAANQLRQEIQSAGEHLFDLARELRELSYAPDLSNTIPLVRTAISMLKVAESNRIPVVQTVLGSMIYLKAVDSHIGGTAAGESLRSRFADLCESLDTFKTSYASLKTSPVTFEHAWAQFWLYREIGSMSNLLSRFAMISGLSMAESGVEVSSILSTLFNAEEWSFTEAIKLYPSSPTWLEELANQKDDPLIKFVGKRTDDVDMLLRYAIIEEQSHSAFRLYLTSESFAGTWIRKMESTDLTPADRCLLARWQVDRANVTRNIVSHSKQVTAWANWKGVTAKLSRTVSQATLQECEASIRSAIETFQMAARDGLVGGSPKSEKMLSWMHQEYGHIIKIQRDPKRYRQALWNHIISCELDPLRLAKVNTKTAGILRDIENDLGTVQFEKLKAELEKKGRNTSFASFDYDF